MSQCVPRWDLDDPPNQRLQLPVHHHPSAAPHFPMSDSEVAELTWENGQLTMHGLRNPGIAKPIPKYPSSSSAVAAWEKPGPSGTLECIIDQATRSQILPPTATSWPGVPLHQKHCNAAAAADGLVPRSHRDDNSDWIPDPASGRKRARVGKAGRNCASQGSAAPTARRGESTVVTLDTWEMTASPDDAGFTTTSASPSPGEGGGSRDTDNTSFGGGMPPTIDDHDSFSQDRVGEGEEKVTDGKTGRSSISTKRRASAIHNQSERKRRDRINERMKTLQKMVPNSSKTDKASMLDEVIEYLKQLQAQVQMMSRMSSIPHMMMPMAMPQLQLYMLSHMSQMAQMGMGMGMMELNPLGLPGHAGMPAVFHPSAFLPHLAGGSWDAPSDRMHQPVGGTVLPDPFSAFLASSTQQPMGMDAFNRMAALYQQLYPQAPPANPKT